MMDLFFVGVVDLLVLFNANLNSRLSLLNAFLAPGSFRKKLHTVEHLQILQDTNMHYYLDVL